jgi:hypothetical protein
MNIDMIICDIYHQLGGMTFQTFDFSFIGNAFLIVVIRKITFSRDYGCVTTEVKYSLIMEMNACTFFNSLDLKGKNASS